MAAVPHTLNSDQGGYKKDISRFWGHFSYTSACRLL